MVRLHVGDMQSPPVADCPPESSTITNYDKQHLVTYLRLLDADAAAVDWREAVEAILGLDPDGQGKAKAVYEAHLARQMDDEGRL